MCVLWTKNESSDHVSFLSANSLEWFWPFMRSLLEYNVCKLNEENIYYCVNLTKHDTKGNTLFKSVEGKVENRGC